MPGTHKAWFDPQARWLTSVIPAPRREMQEDQKFKTILRHTGSLRPIWPIWDTVTVSK